MRKLLSLFTALLFVGSMWGATATITFSNQTYGTGDSGTEYTTATIISNGIASKDELE